MEVPENTIMEHVELIIPDLGPDSPNPIPVKLINLILTYQIKTRRFSVSEDGSQTFDSETAGGHVRISEHQFPIAVFNDDDDTLLDLISSIVSSSVPEVDAGTLAGRIKEQWVLFKEDVSARSTHQIFPLLINFVFFSIQWRPEEMLEKVKKEEYDSDEICAICLDNLCVEDGLRMPCLHEFHGDCIQMWLRKSHSCPICRFQMPTH